MKKDKLISTHNKLLFLRVLEIYQECRYNTLFFDSATHYIVDFEHVIRELSEMDRSIFIQYFMNNESKQDVAHNIKKSPVSVWRHINEIELFIITRMEEKGMLPVSDYFKGRHALSHIPL